MAIEEVRTVESLKRLLEGVIVPYEGDSRWSHIQRAKRVRHHGDIHSELEVMLFMWGLVLASKPELVVETGTDAGLMTRALGCAVWANGRGRVVTCDVDSACTENAEAICQGLPVEVCWTPAERLPELSQADLVFVDSSYPSRRKELGMIKKGALLAVHDTMSEPGFGLWVRAQGFQECFEIRTPCGVTLLRRT